MDFEVQLEVSTAKVPPAKLKYMESIDRKFIATFSFYILDLRQYLE